MKKYGKVIVYDGYIGNIVDKEGIKYIFTNKDLKDKKIMVGDLVIFNSEIFETVEIKEYMARFVTKVPNEEGKSTR